MISDASSTLKDGNIAPVPRDHLRDTESPQRACRTLGFASWPFAGDGYGLRSIVHEGGSGYGPRAARPAAHETLSEIDVDLDSHNQTGGHFQCGEHCSSS